MMMRKRSNSKTAISCLSRTFSGVPLFGLLAADWNVVFHSAQMNFLSHGRLSTK